jgi:hypothetical protein
MTLSTLICTKCSSPVAVSGRAVVLPFVCDDCDFSFTQEYTDMAPKKTSTKEVTPTPCEAGTCDCVPESKTYPPSAGGPGCDTASIENTTALIADLELQLEAERQTVIKDEAKIAELEMRLIEAKDNFAKDCQTVVNLLDQNEALGIENFNRGRAVSALFGRNVELSAKLDYVKNQLATALEYEERSYKAIDRLLAENEELKDRLKAVVSLNLESLDVIAN